MPFRSSFAHKGHQTTTYLLAYRDRLRSLDKLDAYEDMNILHQNASHSADDDDI